MLTQKQIQEIKDHLEKSQNPIFFFDNDGDGLCSFLLLQRYIGRGKGVPIKSFPELSEAYFRKVNELNADYIFILDKPIVSKEFFKQAEEINIPIVWIDHHAINNGPVPNYVNYYNPVQNKYSSTEPVTAICYEVSKRKEDLWLAVIGCISDGFVPDFYRSFLDDNPDLTIKSKNALEIYYNSEIGRVAKIFNFALKDKTTNVINMLRFLMKAKSPYDILDENSRTYTMHKRFNEINQRYLMLLEKAKRFAKKSDKLLFFQYSGSLSISSDLANELMYLFPDKIVVVAYLTGVKVNISARGKRAKKIVLKAIENFDDATGGGHEVAVGAKIKMDDLEEFKKKLRELVK